MAASIGCRKLYKRDGAGFFAALQLIPLRSNRIKLLSSIDESDAGLALSKKPWASHHLFWKEKGVSDEVDVDLVSILVDELDSEKRYNEAAETFENRGFLLEAADRYDLLAEEEDSRFLASKAIELRVRWVELNILANKWKNDREGLLSKAKLRSRNSDDIPFDVRYSLLISQAILNERISDLLEIIKECKASVMWQYRSLKMILDSSSRPELLDDLSGRNTSDRLGFILRIAEKMKYLAIALRRKSSVRTQEENLAITRAEGYFDLAPQRLDRTRLETNPIVNLRLREVLHSARKVPITLSALSDGNSLLRGFTQVIDRDKMHFILSQYVYKAIASLLMILDDLIRVQEQTIRPCAGNPYSTTSIQEYVDCLQIHISCVKSMSSLHRGGATSEAPWISMKKIINSGKEFSHRCLLDILLSEKQLLFTIDPNASDTTNTVILKQEATNSLKEFVTAQFNRLPWQSKKQDIKHVIIYWRLLGFCSKSDGGSSAGSSASDELHKEILRIEKHQQTENKFRRKQFTHYFINKSKKKMYPRLWLWAVESAPEDIMNSISVVERMIQTSYRDGLTCLTKFEQVSLLELNAVAVLGALSLRYSEADSPPMLIPKHFYLKQILGGDSGYLQGFGVSLKRAILTYCHKRFDVVFEKCVLHLENTIGIILGNGLLSAVGEGEDTHRFEMALHLGIFICCNAVVFSSAGKDMDTIEFKRDLSALPSLPLQGNVRKLVVELKKIFTQKLWPSHLDKFLANQPNTFLDLANISDSLLRLRASKRDSYVLCKLQQRTGDEANLCCCEQLDECSAILAKIPFDDCDGIFVNWDTKSVTFLNQVDRVDLNCDDGEHGRKSEELNASRVIFQFIENKMCGKTNAEVDEAIAHFRHWKSVMHAVVRKVKILVDEKSLLLQEKKDSAVDSRSGVMACLFERIVNPLQDAQVFQYQKQNTLSEFNNAVTDATECTYCNLVFDPEVQAERFHQWNMEGRRMPFLQFVRNFNREKFGFEHTTNGQFLYHVRSSMHHDNVMKYRQNLEHFAIVIARMRMGLSLLHQIINMCGREGEKDDAISPWYLHTAEEGRELANRIDLALREIGRAGIIWSRQPSHGYLWTLLPGAYRLPDEAECFFLKKKDDEARMKERDVLRPNVLDNFDREGTEGTILNPGATSFVPNFSL